MNEQETNSDGSGSSGGGGGSPTTGGSTGNSRSITARQSSNSTASDNSTTSSSSDPYDVVIDDKAFHETYLAPFCDAVKSGVAGTMCAMNKVNGTYSVRSIPLFSWVLSANYSSLWTTLREAIALGTYVPSVVCIKADTEIN
jgi:beta-glucosidase